MPDWLVQNFFSSLLWEILLLVGGAAVFAYLRARVPKWAPSAGYGIVAATCIAILMFTFTGHGFLVKQRPEVTPDNVEENIRQWTDSAGLSVAKAQSIPGQDIYFGLQITLSSGNQLSVFRAKQNSGFLQLQSPLALSPEHLAMLSKLSKEQADDATEEITLELDRDRIGFLFQRASAPSSTPTTRPSVVQETILVLKPLAIANLNEGAFIACINELDNEIGIVKNVSDLTLKRYSREASRHIRQQ